MWSAAILLFQQHACSRARPSLLHQLAGKHFSLGVRSVEQANPCACSGLPDSVGAYTCFFLPFSSSIFGLLPVTSVHLIGHAPGCQIIHDVHSHAASYSYQVYTCTCTLSAPNVMPSFVLKWHMQGRIVEQAGRQLSGLENWHISREQQPYIDVFQDRKADLVYLTADSPNELSELDSSKLYIIGGIVDRNRHKNICFRKAESQVTLLRRHCICHPR